MTDSSLTGRLIDGFTDGLTEQSSNDWRIWWLSYLIDWLTDYDWQIDLLAYKVCDWLSDHDLLTNWPTDWVSDWVTEWLTEWLTD